jgi:ABC-type dipeptide/oligopeptide/nickel transport system permease subunit
MAQATLTRKAIASESPWRRSLRILAGNRMAMAGAAIILIWGIVAIAAPLLAPYDALAQKIDDRLGPPSAQHLFGTDELGRDVFSRVVYGAQISLPVGLLVVLFATLLGALVGALAVILGGSICLSCASPISRWRFLPSCLRWQLLRCWGQASKMPSSR